MEWMVVGTTTVYVERAQTIAESQLGRGILRNAAATQFVVDPIFLDTADCC
jgi:hypothetical protein